jgi:hypothetical protein
MARVTMSIVHDQDQCPPTKPCFLGLKGKKGTRLFVFLLPCGEKSIPKKLLIEAFFHIACENVELSLQEASGFPYSPRGDLPRPQRYRADEQRVSLLCALSF